LLETLSVLLALLAGSSPLISAGEITYQLIDGAAGDQNGHSLSGFITFDTPCGTTCTASNITDFSFSVAGIYNYGYSYSSPTDVTVVNGLGHINVLETKIDLNSSVIGQLAIGKSSTGYVQWVGGDNHIYRSLDPDTVWVWFTNSRSSTIAIATPEPSTLPMGLALVLALSGFCRRRPTPLSTDRYCNSALGFVYRAASVTQALQQRVAFPELAIDHARLWLLTHRSLDFPRQRILRALPGMPPSGRHPRPHRNLLRRCNQQDYARFSQNRTGI
jgi:hypothetical protein